MKFRSRANTTKTTDTQMYLEFSILFYLFWFLMPENNLIKKNLIKWYKSKLNQFKLKTRLVLLVGSNENCQFKLK